MVGSGSLSRLNHHLYLRGGGAHKTHVRVWAIRFQKSKTELPASCCRASTTDRSITSSSWPEATRAPSPAGRSGRRTCCMCRRGPRGLAVRPCVLGRAGAARGGHTVKRQLCNDTQLKTSYRIMSSLSALHHKMGKKV